MTKQHFVEGWQRLLVAFDVKKSNEHMAEVYRAVQGTEGDHWMPTITEIIEGEEHFPRIAVILKYLLAKARHSKPIELPQNKQSREFMPSWYWDAISKVFGSGGTHEERRKKLDEIHSQVRKEINFTGNLDLEDVPY